MSLITNTQINIAMSDKYHNDNSEETRQEITNIIMNHAQMNTQILYILEEREVYR
ncbi:19356_t:CDS:1, partial [Racocetra persica]